MNRIQQAYAVAKAHHDTIKSTNDQHEAEYCASHGYTTGEGKPALHIWMIDDEAIFEIANVEYGEDTEHQYNEEIKAREVLTAAEDALIEWGLSILPAHMQHHAETLRKEAKRLVKVRNELIDLAFKVDHRTIAMA